MTDRDARIDSDQPTKEDLLSFAPYHDTLINVVHTAETPLTIGVFGAWGSGKTSLLRMLQSTLSKPYKDQRAKVVWFNAWQYGQEEALWRALLARISAILSSSKAIVPVLQVHHCTWRRCTEDYTNS